MAGQRDVEAVNRELRERIRELERQLVQRDTAPGRQRFTLGRAPLVDQLDALLAFEPAILYVTDRAGTLVHVTTRDLPATRIAELLGQSAFDQVHPDCRDEYRHRLDQVLALGEPIEFELKVSDGDTGLHRYRARVSPCRSSGGADSEPTATTATATTNAKTATTTTTTTTTKAAPIIGALTVLVPIDDERQTRIENKRFRAILDRASEGIFVVDPRSGRFIDVNTTACRLLRYTRRELLALSPADIVADLQQGARHQWHDLLIEIMAVGVLVRESLYQGKDGDVVPVEETLRVETFEGDEYLLMVCRDLTEANRIKEELRLAEETLRVSDRLTTVGTLAAGVAHEINNPLAYVMGNIEFATEQIQSIAASLPDPARQEILESLEEARHGASRMSRIVRDLRTFSRKDEETTGPVAVNEVIDSSINIAMNEIRPRAQLERDYTDDLLVIANESRIGQVFLNLIINAAQAIPLGDAKNQRITVRTSQAGESVVVAVSDTGTGMSPDVAARIFEPFFTTKPLGVGTGLGLAICQSIIEGLGGHITVATQPGQGTTFRVYLPLATEKAVRASQSGLAKRGGKAGRILIIDDDVRAARALRRILHIHDVTIETDGKAGLAQATQQGFDLVFCDMMMPDFGGIEFYEALARRDPALAARIIFVTGGTFTQRARDFLEHTENDFVSKPYDAQQVRRMVSKRLD